MSYVVSYFRAYNILADVEDSEDVLQNVMIKVVSVEGVESEMAYLVRAVINESINFKKRRDKLIEQDVWLPEPYVTNGGEQKIESQEILKYSLLVLLDTLNIHERAVFLLKEVFAYRHEEICAVLSINSHCSRQHLSRARKKLKSRSNNSQNQPSKSNTELDKYISAIRNGDLSSLESMLADEVQLFADGGGIQIVAASTNGIRETVEVLTYVFNQYQKDLDVLVKEVNHQPALLFYKDRELINCQVFEFSNDGKIARVFSVVDPGKLAHVEPR